jgi:hypothetical protein
MLQGVGIVGKEVLHGKGESRACGVEENRGE